MNYHTRFCSPANDWTGMLALQLSKVTVPTLLVAISICYISGEDLLDVDQDRLGMCSIFVTVSTCAPMLCVIYTFGNSGTWLIYCGSDHW